MLISVGYRFIALDGYLVGAVPFDNDGRSARTAGRSCSRLVVWSRHVTEKQNFLAAANDRRHDGMLALVSFD